MEAIKKSEASRLGVTQHKVSTELTKVFKNNRVERIELHEKTVEKGTTDVLRFYFINNPNYLDIEAKVLNCLGDLYLNFGTGRRV
ncbi:MAG: hypothetical protein LBM02_08105 [Lachnospiraceae bacterium]|jgi:hypothetical protein|nr:hypothetical protein [Lachnospiraceae bacterium]